MLPLLLIQLHVKIELKLLLKNKNLWIQIHWEFTDLVNLPIRDKDQVGSSLY